MVNWGYQKKRFRIKWRCPHCKSPKYISANHIFL